MMKKWSLVLAGGGALALALLILADLPEPQAADHDDAPAVEATPLTDLSDLYVWMSSDASTVNLVMTVHPDFQGATAVFDPAAIYRFHIEADAPPDEEHHTIDCTYDETLEQMTCQQPGTGNIHVVSVDTVTQPTTGNLRAFAGVRDDPFFFNAAGFSATASAVRQAEADGLYEYDEHGCPTLVEGEAEALAQCLSTACDAGPGDPGNAAAENALAGQNVLAIVVSLPKADLDAAGNTPTTLQVWASTVDGDGNQIDRVGRPAISTALLDPFGRAANPDELKNSYNTADDPSTWVAMFAGDIEASLAVFDALDSAGPDSE